MKGGNYKDPCQDSGQELRATLSIVGSYWPTMLRPFARSLIQSTLSLSLPLSPSPSLPLSLDEW